MYKIYYFQKFYCLDKFPHISCIKCNNCKFYKNSCKFYIKTLDESKFVGYNKGTIQEETIMTTSKKVQNAIKNYLSDHKNHSTKEMKDYLNSQNLQYTEGHFSGSVNTLLQNGSIKKIDRGIYAIADNGSRDAEIMTMLQKILTEIAELKAEMKSINTQTIETIIKSLRS